MTPQHAKFLDRLDASSSAVYAVASMYQRLGIPVMLPATHRAPSAEEAADYFDEGDLFVLRRMEVKGLGINFTCRADWPFREAFVSNVAAVDRAGDEVCAYISVSKDKRYCAIIPHSSRPHWYVVEKRVSNTGNIERNYACPLDHVQFRNLRAKP